MKVRKVKEGDGKINPFLFGGFKVIPYLCTRVKQSSISDMETYYEVTYTDKQGNRRRWTRDTVMRGHQLYKDCVRDGMTDVVLREVSDSGTAQLRPYTPSRVQERPKVETRQKEDFRPKDWFEALCGMPREEYMECVERFASFHGATLEDWGMEK